MTLIAIDPGVSGGIAYCGPDGEAACINMPDTEAKIVDAIRMIVAARGNGRSYIEDVPKFTGRNIPSSTTAVMFQNVGVIRGALIAMGIPMVSVPPKQWQKHFPVGSKSSCSGSAEWKRKLRAQAENRFPHLNVTLKTADALLILEYAMFMEKGGKR